MSTGRGRGRRGTTTKLPRTVEDSFNKTGTTTFTFFCLYLFCWIFYWGGGVSVKTTCLPPERARLCNSEESLLGLLVLYNLDCRLPQAFT